MTNCVDAILLTFRVCCGRGTLPTIFGLHHQRIRQSNAMESRKLKKLVLFVFVLLLNGQDERLILHLMCWSLGECQNIGVNPLGHQSQGHETHEYPLSCHQHLKIFNIYFVIPGFSQ